MSDDIVKIILNNDLVTDPNGNTAQITGSVQVDYTTNSYSGNYTVTGAGISASGSLSDSGGLVASGGNYTIADGSFLLTFSGQQPLVAVSESYSTMPIVVSGVPIIPGDTYSGTAQSLVSTPVCFVQGTRIRTKRGDISVEALEVGDLVITASGAGRPVKWLGHRTIDCRRHPNRAAVLPVRVAANAFGGNRPVRDLLVSPGHALCVDISGEILIPAEALIDGAAVTQVEVPFVTYWHVELETHDIILAENMPAESYLDMGNRSFFADTAVVALASVPEASGRTHADFCRPFVDSGPVVDAIRGRLALLAAASRPGADAQPISTEVSVAA